MKHKRILAEFWRKHYNTEVNGFGGYCCLCGNTGIIDTSNSAYTPTGKLIGKKVYCMCPNGRIMNPEDK